MAHTHDVYDMENHFEINGSSRFIKETSETKLVVVQGDHKSEVLTFKMPRYIDGHDMTLCNKIRIHYINLDTKTNNKSADVYEVTDLTLCEECEDVLTFTWTIEAPATKYSGTLSFLVKFECTEGENILYQWNTAKYVGTNVLAGIDNSEEFVDKYSNVLEEWYNELTRGADTIEALNEQSLAEIELAKEDAKEDIQGKADATMAEMNRFSSNAYNSFKNDVDKKAAETLESIPEDYTALDARVKEIEGNFYVSYSDNVNNVYNPADLVTGKKLNTDGSVVDYSGWNMTGYMAVKPDTTYNLYYTNGTARKSASGNYVLYDKYKNIISGGASSSFTTTPETAYVRFSTVEARFNELQVGININGTTQYEEYIAPTKITKLKESVLPDNTELHKSVETLSEKMQYTEYEAIESEIITGAYARKENGNIITNQSSEMAYCMVDVVENEKYLVTSYVTANTAIVFYANSLYLSDFNNLGEITDYEIVIPEGCTKMAVSTRNIVTHDFSVKKATAKFIDAANIMENLEKVEQENDDFDFETIEESDRLFALETRLGFKWKEFDTGKVVFMTDDTNSDIGVITSLLMNTYSFPMSYACITSKLENAVDENANGYNTVKDVLLASQEFGGEVLSHSIDTNDWGANSTTNGGYNGAVPSNESERRLQASKMALRTNGIKCNGFVSPRGCSMIGYIEQLAKYYRYAYYQGADVPQIYHFTRVNIKGYTLEALKQIIDECAANKTLLVLMCHTVVDSDGEGYGYYPNGFTLENFTSIMDYLKWGNDETKATERTDIEVTTLKSVYDQYASIG